jgi:hypothetical protein
MDPRINHHPEKCNRTNRLLFSGPTGAGWDFFVNACITLLIDDANVECFGV